MANVLTVPNSGIISFDSRAYSDLTVPPLSTSARIGYDGGGGVNITSYTTATTALDRFSVDGTQGRLFSVTDALTGTLFSVNNITGLPILEVQDSNTVIAGQYNTNALVVSGTRTGLGTTPIGTNRLSVSGDSTFVGTISTSSHGTSENWNTAFNRTTQYQSLSSTFATNSTVSSVSSLLTPLTVTRTLTGQLLLTSVYQGASGNWQSAYTAVAQGSSNWYAASGAAVTDSRNYVHTNFLPLTGGVISGNLTVNSNLSVLGTTTYIDTNVALTSAMYIDTNSSETALRITQRGSGDVLRVEDTANPDSTPFVINSTGNVGIGLTTPTTTLEVSGITKISQGLVVGNEVGGYVVSGNHKMQSVAPDGGNVTPLTLVGGTALLEMYKDSTPTKAVSFGMAIPGTTAEDDLIFTIYDGSSWSEAFRAQSSTNNIGIGTTTPVTKLNIEGDFTANSAFKAGSIEIQPYALNNAWIGENVYLDGSNNFIRRATGSAGLFYFQGSEGQFRFASSDTAGTSVPSDVKLKISHEGKFGVGNAVDSNYDGFTGSILYADGAGKVGVNTITPNEALTVVGNLSATGTLSLSTVQIRTRPTANVFIGDSTTGNNTNTGNHNFVFGLSAGNALTDGSNNVFIGACAGRLTTGGLLYGIIPIGINNNFLGNAAGFSNTTGRDNNFFGCNAGRCNTTGGSNNFFGCNAGLSNTTGGFNNFFGCNAGRCNTTGGFNNFLGRNAGYSNTTGSNNNFLGNQAGILGNLGTAVGSRNSFFGAYAGVGSAFFATVSASNNSFFGVGAGRAITNGCNNNIFGYNAGCANTTGNCNNFIGDFVGRNNTTGNSNNFLGNDAGCCNTTGNSNLFLGNSAGGFNRVGSNNIFIGNNANTASAQMSALSGIIVLGTGAIATESHQVVLSTANVLFRSTGSTFEIGSPSLTDNLTVYGTISSTQAIFASGGNSDQWNSSFTTTQANTATDSFDLSYVGTLPVPLIPILTVNPLRDALIGASGSQAATLRNGKWISGLSITGFNNPTIDNLISLSSTNIVGIRDSFSLSSLTKLSAVSFPSLASIGGSFTCGQNSMNSLTTLSFPSLASVGGNFAGSSGGMNSLTTFSFPSLASVGGNFIVTSGGMNSLTAVSFPSLSSVGGTFQIIIFFPINILTTMSFPSLASVGGAFTVFSNNSMNSLTAVSFPSLVSVNGNFTVSSGGTLERLFTLSFPSLASVGGAFTANNGGNMNSLTTLSFPSLASVGGNFTVTTGSMISLTTLLIGSGLKHINGDFSSGSLGLDRHNAWSASTYYPSATSFTAPASAFSSTTTGTTCSAAITNHGLQTNDIITVFGITGTTAATHNFNAAVVAVTRIDANNFNYTIAATTQIPIGTATILRQEVAVTPVTKNGRKYICTGAGTSGGTEPAWPTTIGATVADGTATWTCSELSLSNILSRLDALSGTNQTTTYGANRSISIGPATLITVNSISTAAGVATITTATNHGITTGTQVVISGCTGTALRYNGVWTVTSTGLTTLTTPVPTDLNGVAGAGTMRLINASPQFTGSMPISATTVTGISADSHMIFSATQLRDVDSGTSLPIFVAGIYNRNGTTNGFARYSCTENGWDIWYDTTSKRWVNSPSQFTGNAATVGNYAHTAQSVPLASTSTGNPASITSTVNHGITTGAVFTVVIEGCSNAALNGSWTATSIGPATFTIPVDGSGGATTSSGTVTVLNQTFNQGILMTGTVASPIQGVQQTITTAGNHGFSTGDFIHFYGAVGTHAASINDLNTTASTKSVTTSITVNNATTFRCIRYANTQPFVGSYTLTTLPHMRDPSVNDVAYHTSLKLRARGIAVSLRGNTGI